jgi:hypothetical protein
MVWAETVFTPGVWLSSEEESLVWHLLLRECVLGQWYLDGKSFKTVSLLFLIRKCLKRKFLFLDYV